MPQWQNYGANRTITLDTAPATPGSLADLVNLVQGASSGVKAFASRHSWSAVSLVEPGDTFVDLSAERGPGGESARLQEVGVLPTATAADGADHGHLVACEAGVRVRDLIGFLDGQSLALPTVGAVNAQTLAGAFGSGTHGSSLEFGPMANMAVAFIVVTGEGEVWLVQPTRPAIKTNPAALGNAPAWFKSAVGASTAQNSDNLFYACSTGLGLVGLIYASVIRAVDQHYLEETATVKPWSAAKLDLAEMGDILAGAASRPDPLRDINLLLNPYSTGGANENKCKVSRTASTATCTNCRPVPDILGHVDRHLAQHEREGRPPAAKGSWFHRLLGHILGWVARHIFRKFSHTLPIALDKAIESGAGQRTGLTQEIRTRDGYEVVGWGMEVAVPPSRAADAIDWLLAEAPALREGGQNITGPISIRGVPETKAAMGISFGGPRITIELTMLGDTRHARETFAYFQRELIDQFDGIAHFGMDWDVLTEVDIQATPRAQFCQALAKFDPAGRFTNTFARKLGLVATPQP